MKFKRRLMIYLVFLACVVVILNFGVPGGLSFFSDNPGTGAWMLVQDGYSANYPSYDLWGSLGSVQTMTNSINTMTSNGIDGVVLFVGNWNPAKNSVDFYIRSSATYQTYVNLCHDAGIKHVVVWVEDDKDYGEPTLATSQGTYNNAFLAITNYCHADGFFLDFENLLGTLQPDGSRNFNWNDPLTVQFVNFNNQVTSFLHTNGKLSTVAMGFDNNQNVYAHVQSDFIFAMFYAEAGSTLEDVQAPYYWQEMFQCWSGVFPASASPIVPTIDCRYNPLGAGSGANNKYLVSWQLNQVTNYLTLYSHRQLGGVAIWIMEYMSYDPNSWSALRTFLVGTSPNPTATPLPNPGGGPTPTPKPTVTASPPPVPPQPQISFAPLALIGSMLGVVGVETHIRLKGKGKVRGKRR